jgi:hypothetical protein
MAVKGCIGLSDMKAPFLKDSRYLPFVVEPSGKMQNLDFVFPAIKSF